MTHYLIERVPVTHCRAGCGRQFDVEVRYYRRGSCSACESRHRRNSTAPRRRRNVALQTVLAEYESLSTLAYRPREIARRLGMTDAAFDRAMKRGREAGDPRVATFRGMGPVPTCDADGA